MKYSFVEEFDPNGAQGKLLSQVKPESVVLECGCASGYMTRYMKEKLGCTVYIVEYDRGGFDNAVQYAKDGICGDLMADEWFEKFADMRFDQIMFADVLEHLRDPISVIKRAVQLLKDDGVILISLPNVGHNDIVVKLLTGNWDYTSIGLLDDTHIHFWGLNNLDGFFAEAGLKITIKDCTETPTGRTEQYDNKKFPADEKIYSLIKDRTEGEIYQFVLTLQKSEYVEKNGIEAIDKLPRTASSSLGASSLQELQIQLSNKEGHIQLLLQSERELKSECNALRESCESLQTELNNREGECRQLREKENMYLNEIRTLRNSRSYRLGQKFAKVLRFFIPIGSKRAVICKLLFKAVRHPIAFMKGFSIVKVKKFFKLLSRGNTEYLNEVINNRVIPSMIELKAPEIIPVDLNANKSFEDYATLNVPQWSEPLVSIIIPVYNQFEYTYRCVQSIMKNSGEVSYEIIIANDCSTDLTTRIEEILVGVKCVTNEQNLRFLRNCNNAAKHAKGKYVLFLNNDTQVQRDWLKPLVTLIESADDIGMVGSKLIYPDGKLQEAGGILWRDGSAWNFGNGQNPAQPEFNYVKQVDYISGAAIMLERALWEEIGGFDEYFAPAYCEDSDLAFTVRKMGYRVMYQPLSVVVHFEGVSNGTDTSSGQKKYQIENSEKFLNKWKEELDKHPENAQNVFQARDYSYGKKTLLMIDHYVPQFDKDAGSRTVFQYLKLFAKAGFNVKFIGDNFYRDEPYTTVLQQMGIEVLYGPDYANHWKDWVKENAGHIDYVFLNRPHIAPKYLDFLRENTGARIIYYGHDLAFMREMREYEVTGDASFKTSSEEWRPREIELMKKADVAYYPSYVEVDEIHKIDASVNVKAIPAYIFENIEWQGYDFESRRDIMFIGGFAHRPNVDAVKWLAGELLPRLVKLIPDIKVHVLGSNPPKEVLALANENLIMEGFVTDEQLEAFYLNSRISLIPLRYGAGIKGKVVEAMRYGTPVVTTSVGSEGIPDAETAMVVEDDVDRLAEKIAALYEDKEKLTYFSQNSVSYVKNNYSPDNAINIIGKDFGLE